MIALECLFGALGPPLILQYQSDIAALEAARGARPDRHLIAHGKSFGKARRLRPSGPTLYRYLWRRRLTGPLITPKTRAPGGFQVRRAFRDPWQGLALTRLCLSVPAQRRDRGGRDPHNSNETEDANDQAQ